MLVLIWLTLSAIILFTIDLLSYSLHRSGWSRFVSTFLLFYAQVILTEFALGLFFALNTVSLTLINLFVTGLVLFGIHKKFGGTVFRKYASSLGDTLDQTAVKIRKDPLWITLTVVALALLGWIIFLGVIFPATDFDGNSYHLTFMGNVIQYGTFFDHPTSLPWLNGYPKGGEFIGMWSVILTHADTFVDLAQIPFLFLGIYALYSISKTLGSNEKQARFASLLFLFLPIVLNQLKTTYVDVMLSALFFAAIAMVIKKKLDTLDLVLVGIIFSLLISIKATGILFVIVVLPLLAWNLFQNRKNRKKMVINEYIRPLLLVALPMAFGLYWYIKNLLVYGTPIYPFGFKAVGVSIFPGKTFQEFAAAAETHSTVLPTGYFERIWFVWTEQKDWFGCLYNYDANYTGLGPIWFIILIPATIMGVFYALQKKNTTYFAVLASIVALFAIYPANYYSRYTMFITAIGMVSLAIVLTNARTNVANFVKVMAIFLAIIVFATNIALCNFTPRMVRDQVKSLATGEPRGAVFTTNKPTWGAFVFLDTKVRAGDVVAYDSSPYFIYPLWKVDFSNTVVYVPADSSADWHKELDRKSVDYVLTTIKSTEQKWASKSVKMKSVYKDAMYEVYEVK